MGRQTSHHQTMLETIRQDRTLLDLKGTFQGTEARMGAIRLRAAKHLIYGRDREACNVTSTSMQALLQLQSYSLPEQRQAVQVEL